MEPWQIILLIVVILVFLYLINIIVVLSYAVEIKKNLINRVRTLSVVMLNKIETLQKLSDLLLKKGYSFQENELQILEEMKEMHFDSTSVTKFKECVKKIGKVEQAVNYGVLDNENDEEIEKELVILKEINNLYSKSIIAYNYDVNGYNYWVKIPHTKYICILFKLKPKQLIA
ncbi:MAG: hypothetical protein SPL00_01810 [Bacilli bacterium]|nr:hypothetical protein [Bacilli bacterium]